MSAPHHDGSRGGPDRVRTPAERAADAARATQVRATRRRDRLAAAGGAILEELLAPGQPHPPWTKTAVAAFYGVGEAAVGQVRRGYAAEFRRDGWRDRDGDTAELFPEQAVVRVGLLLARSEIAAELRYRLGMDAAAPLRYSDTEQRVEQCRRHYEDALALVEDTRHLDPADVWRSLLNTDHHDLMALAITLAALVPTDRPELGRWVKDLSAADPPRRSVARGLALLIPTRPPLHALPVTAPLRAVPVRGLP